MNWVIGAVAVWGLAWALNVRLAGRRMGVRE